MGSEGVDCEVGKNLYKVCEQRAREERLAEMQSGERELLIS